MTDRAEAVVCARDVEVTCRFRRVREDVFLEGTVDTVLELACCRCLETASLPVGVSFRYTFVPAPERQEQEIELSGDELEYGYYGEDMIDLEPVVFEQIALQIPMRVLCDENCRGLCPRCGANLNQEACRCTEKEIDERFAILKNLKINK